MEKKVKSSFVKNFTLFDNRWGLELALFDIFLGSVQCWWQKLLSFHVQH